MEIVKTENLSKYYTDGTIVKAVDGVNLTLKKGEFTALVGPSGSGKTTLLNLIGGIDKPSEGKVFIDGQEISLMPEKKLAKFRLHKLGFVFQSFNLIPVLTAYENVELILLFQGVPKNERRERVMRIFKELGIEELADRTPSKMSGGQQQRVAIARAIVHTPSLVLADEPTANLDSENAIAIVELMKKMSEEKGITFLIATHDSRVFERTRRIIKIIDGKIHED
ncbi:MAG: ABC transporter ATP-binding protein [Candidatus Aminicenantes bacterium]|nr:ABC transporter ATP-binding protein [Candidatus Aminicenantes bacterium]